MQQIFSFLRDIAAHNDREWFHAHRARYDAAAADFSALAGRMISRIARFEPEVAGLPIKDTLYRFYRDTRFSMDKSPYKSHFGTYINPRGKKSLHGGYYLHLEPGASMVAVGAYCLPSPILRAVRQSIVDFEATFDAIMKEPALVALRPRLGENYLKTLPAGFPRTFAHPEYLRPREYCLSIDLPDAFFEASDWEDRAADRFRLMKPFLDFVNDTVDDYI